MENLNLKKLFELQEKLDEHVAEQHDIKEDVSDLVIIGFKVEFAEFLNEHKFFKFWKVDRTSNVYAVSACGCERCSYHYMGDSRNPLLEEYVDGIHFLLSLGIRRKYNKFIHAIPTVVAIEDHEKTISWLAQDIFNNTLDSAGNWIQCIVDYLKFGELVGFTAKVIEDAYLAKNKVNHERQDNGY